MWKRISNGTIVEGSLIEGKYYLTASYKFGEITNVQVLAFKQGLWWREDRTYTYYQPTHYKEI